MQCIEHQDICESDCECSICKLGRYDFTLHDLPAISLPAPITACRSLMDINTCLNSKTFTPQISFTFVVFSLKHFKAIMKQTDGIVLFQSKDFPKNDGSKTFKSRRQLWQGKKTRPWENSLVQNHSFRSHYYSPIALELHLKLAQQRKTVKICCSFKGGKTFFFFYQFLYQGYERVYLVTADLRCHLHCFPTRCCKDDAMQLRGSGAGASLCFISKDGILIIFCLPHDNFALKSGAQEAESTFGYNVRC